MHTLTITFIQTDLHWESPEANLGMFEEKIWQIEEDTDVILLPEMYTTGFSMNVQKMAEPHGTRTLKWMRQMAAQTGSCLMGSAMIREGNTVFNRLYAVEPGGTYLQYDKRHLFRMGREHAHYSRGEHRIIQKVKDWKICPLICYDLRFPVWSRNTIDAKTATPEYDLLLYVANWPAQRNRVWRTLLQARSIENLCYTAGLNITGRDGEGVAYCGNSLLVDFKGDICLDMGDKQDISTITIDKEVLDAYREKFPAHLDADSFSLT